MQGNEALYLNQMFESVALPVIRYRLRVNTPQNEIVNELKTIDKEQVIRNVHSSVDLKQLIMQSKKLGLFTYCYKSKWYNLLVILCRMRYALMK